MILTVPPAKLTANRARETEITDLQIVLVVKKNILALEVAMGHTALMHEAEGVEELHAVKSAYVGGQATLVRQIVE